MSNEVSVKFNAEDSELKSALNDTHTSIVDWSHLVANSIQIAGAAMEAMRAGFDILVTGAQDAIAAAAEQ